MHFSSSNRANFLRLQSVQDRIGLSRRRLGGTTRGDCTSELILLAHFDRVSDVNADIGREV